MFEGAYDFNADISKWVVGQVSRMDKSTSSAVPHLFFIVDGVTDLFFDFI